MKLETKSAILCAAGAALIVIMTSAFNSVMSGGNIDAMKIFWLMGSSQMVADATGNSLNTADWMQCLNPFNYLFSPMLISAVIGFYLGDILATTRRKPAVQRRKKKREAKSATLGRAALEYKAITGDESFLSDVMLSDVGLEDANGLSAESLARPVEPLNMPIGDNP